MSKACLLKLLTFPEYLLCDLLDTLHLLLNPHNILLSIIYILQMRILRLRKAKSQVLNITQLEMKCDQSPDWPGSKAYSFTISCLFLSSTYLFTGT